MPSTAILTVLAFGHILSAMCWLGGGILTALVIAPNLRRMPSAASLEFNSKVLPRVIRFVQAAVGSTFLFGLLLLYYLYSGSFSSLSSSPQGMVLYSGILLAVVVAIVAWTVTFPSFKKVIRISDDLLQSGQQTPSPELAKYGRRARMGSMVGLLLLLIVLALMVSFGFGLY